MHRFFYEDLKDKKIINISQPQLVKQLTAVLRFKAGDKIILFDGSGDDYLVSLTRVDKKTIIGEVQEIKRGVVFSKDFTLYVALLKKENIELVVQKAVELGVSKIVPVLNEHCVKKSISDQQMERLRWIAKEACEQSEGSILPIISSPLSFEDSIKLKSSSSRVRIIANERNGKNSILSYRGVHAIDVFVGPEGGYSEKELSLASASGIISVTLGKRILRAETAAIAVVSAILLP